MPSKLEAFLTQNKIDRRQLLAVSQDLEGLRPEDRAIRLAKKSGKKEEGGEGKAKESRKPRSGKPVTTVALAKVYSGKPVTGPTRTRILRAVNTILERRKTDKVELAALFDLATEPSARRRKKAEKPTKKK
jgi:hypothetical protein